jgi:ribosomal protein L31E
MTKELKTARAKVNQFKFGTPEWEAAMTVVRKLVAKHNDQNQVRNHTSVDGNIFDRR